MKKGRCVFAVAVLFAAELAFAAAVIFAQEDKDSLAIKQAVEDFIKGANTRDLDSALKHVSVNYKKVIDYDMFKNILKRRIAQQAASFNNASVSRLKILSLSIHNYRAEVSVAFKVSAVNTKDNKNIVRRSKADFTLAKENGEWKIITQSQEGNPQ